MDYRKTDQRHFAFQFAANGAHGVHYIAQLLLRIRDRQLVDVGFTFTGEVKRGPSPASKYSPSPMASGMVRMSEKRIAASSG